MSILCVLTVHTLTVHTLTVHTLTVHTLTMDIATEAEEFRTSVMRASAVDPNAIIFPPEYKNKVIKAAAYYGISADDALKFVTTYYRGVKLFPCNKPVGVADGNVSNVLKGLSTVSITSEGLSSVSAGNVSTSMTPEGLNTTPVNVSTSSEGTSTTLTIFSSDAKYVIANIKNVIHVGTIVDERQFIYADHCSTAASTCLRDLTRALSQESLRTYRKLLQPSQTMKERILQDLIGGLVMCTHGLSRVLEIFPSNTTLDIFVFNDNISYETYAIDGQLTEVVRATEKFITTGEPIEIEGMVKVAVMPTKPDKNQCRVCKQGPPDVTLRICGKCKKAQYCSIECQKIDYPSHKKVC
jgi:MYND finger